MIPDEERSDVRGYFPFKVNFKIITKEEYEDLKRFDGEFFFPFNKEQGVDVIDTRISAGNTADASLIKYLLYMDGKLDQILDLLSRDRTVNGLPDYGVGQNISGSGMEIIVDKPLESGQILHSRFFLSKFPLIFMDIFGEVIHVTQVNQEGQTLYQIGIKFINLSVNERERIISSVFQRERERIRKTKSED